MDAEWRTPPEIYQPLDWEFGFRCDAAATPENALTPVYITAEDDAFQTPWGPGPVFCNPPSKVGEHKVGDWLRRGWDQANDQMVAVVFLVRAATGTKVWQELVFPLAEVRFIAGRVSYLRPDGERADPAGFDSAVVIFRPGGARDRISTWTPPPRDLAVFNQPKIRAGSVLSIPDEIGRGLGLNLDDEEDESAPDGDTERQE